MTTKLFSFENHAENDTHRLVPDPFCFFKKTLYEVKASGRRLSFFQSPSKVLNLQTIKTKYIKL